MLNKNKLIALGCFSTILIGAGFYLNSIISREQDNLEQTILSINKSIDNSLWKISPIEKNNYFFFISGSYRLERMSSNPNLSYSLDFKYKLKNPIIQYLFQNKIDISGEVLFDGNFSKILKYNHEPIKYNILYEKNGIFSLKTKEKNLEFTFPKPEYYDSNIEDFLKESKNEGLLTHIENFVFETSFNPLKIEEFSFFINSNKIFLKDIEDPKDNLTIELPKIEYITDLHASNINSLNLYSKKFYDQKGELYGENFNLKTGIKPNLPNYTAFLSANIDNLTIADQKNTYIDFAYSIQNIDKNMIDLYKKFTTTYIVGEDFTPEEINQAKKIITENLITGFSFNIDRVKFKNPKNLINLNGKFEVLGAKEQEKDSFNLPNQSKFLFDLESEGEFSEMINSIFVTSIDSTIEDMNSNMAKQKNLKFINNKFKLELKYENSLLTVNNFPTPTMVNYFIFNWLSTINKELGLSESNSPNIQIDEQEVIMQNMERSLRQFNN